jgi:DNA-binding NtrC family response regulator
MSLSNLGKSPIVLALKERLEKVAANNGAHPSPVLLIGPQGCGAELCARFLQVPDTPWLQLTELSQLVTAPLDILESIRDGLLYVDEVAELNKTEQKGLLLLIAKSDKYNVRVVCATSENLPKLQAEGLFDHNLLQVLSAVSLRVPSLDEHKEDIPDLAVAIANLQFELGDLQYREFDIAALNGLRNANWPGNLAQLDAVIRNLIQTSLGEKITLADVERVLHQFDDALSYPDANNAVFANAPAYLQASAVNFEQPLREARDDFERLYFSYHLKDVQNNMSKLAEIAGLERTHLYRKLKQLGIKIK